MSTPAQILANRQNSLLSTGPKTDAGKAASSSNAISHGFSAVDPVLPSEDRNQFNALLAQHRSDFAPSTEHEEFLVTQLAGAQWKLHRLERMETDMLGALDDPAKAFTDDETAKKFARLERYRASLERTYHRAARELRATHKLQNEANSTEMAQNKFDNLLKAMIEAPPPGYDYEPRLVPVAVDTEPDAA